MAQGVLGDIDTESIIFVDAADSPTGNAGILVAGAWSSTLSWWEFTCDSALGSGSDGHRQRRMRRNRNGRLKRRPSL